MTNALYTTKTPTNQALTVQPWGNRITLPILLPVLLVTLLILSACGGGKAAITVTQDPPPPTPTCATNPFLDSCTSAEHAIARDVIIKECIAGSNPENRPSCANAIAKNPCIRNPYAANCATDFAAYVATAQTQRQTFCRTGDNASDAFCRPAITSICDGNIFDGICNSSTASQETFCRKDTNAADNRNCDSIVKDICDKKPLFDALCTPDVNAQRAFCRMGTNAVDNLANCGPVVLGICASDPFDGLCTVDNTAREDFCRKGDNLTARAGDCAPVAIRVCAVRLFDGLCRNHAVQRSNLCAGSLAGITTAGGVPGDCFTYSSTICGINGAAGTNPFAPICTRIDANSQFATNIRSRNTFCRADLFNPLCDGDYATVQVGACHVNGVPTDANPRCSTIIANNCPITSGVRNSACYTLPVPLTVAASTDPVANYVEGTATGLKLGFVQSALPANISGFESGVLLLSDLTTVTSSDGDTHGVAFASFINSQSKYIIGTQSKRRFYAGLLSTTEFDTALSRNVKRAQWTGKLVLYARNVIQEADFTLFVDFDGNNGTLRADISLANDLFIIDGAFNNGRVYGNTSLNGLNAKQESRSSTGSLDGLIGEDGVVAAVISDSKELDGKGLGNYAGGFVASNPYKGNIDVAVCGSASTDTPFDALCVDNDALRIMLCSTRNALAGTGGTFTTNCAGDRDVVIAICTSSGQYANPFDSVICTDNDLEVQNAFVANCINSDTSLRAGADCAGVTTCVNDPFATGCDAATYAGRRSLTLDFCNTGNVDDPQCANALVNCASAGADANCGTLATTYCAGAAGRTITGDTSTCPARVTPYCVAYPINPICANIAENTDFVAGNLKQIRENFCRRPGNANDPNCALTIAGYCDTASTTGIFDDLCSNRVHFRYNVIASVCDNPDRDTDLDNLCNKPYTYDIKRLEQCQTTGFGSGCGITISSDRHTMIRSICGEFELIGTNPNDPICDDSDERYYIDLQVCGSKNTSGSNPRSPICEIDPQIFITTAVLCGQGIEDGTIGINPFSAICADDFFNPHATTRLEAQRDFCRQDITDDLCPSTIASYCGGASGAGLFDDLCDGDTYLADRVTHCATAFTHAKCETNQMNITDAAAICGTATAPGTNPFNDVCKSKTLSPNITVMSLKATQQAFCRATPNGDCTDTIKAFCDTATGTAIFDNLCDGTDYADARLGYCIHPNANHAECTATVAENKMAITTLCGDAQNTGTNPFSIACTAAFLLRLDIDIVCGGGRNSQLPLCTDENAIPDIDRASVTASQENFCRGDITNTACENTIADFCDLAFDEDILDPLCGGAGYQDMRLITCLSHGIDHPSCNGSAGIVATLCPTTAGAERHESCPLIVNHALYRAPVNEFNQDAGSDYVQPVGFYNANTLEAVGVIDKNKVHVADNLRTDDIDIDDEIERAIGYVTDAPATLITGTTTGLDFGPLPPAGTIVRNGGDPIEVTVTVPSNTAYPIGSPSDGNGYALALAAISTADSSEIKLYAGLLSNTDNAISAPNFDSVLPTGIWGATMNLLMNGGNATVAGATFDLSVNFNTQTIKTLASRPAQFGIVGADFAETRYTAIDSPVVPLFSPDGEPYYRRDSRGEEIIVGRGDTYTDCYGNRLNPGSKIRLCEGGGLPDYNSYRFSGGETLAVDRFGNPTIRTVSKSTTGRLTVDAHFNRLGLVYGDITIQTGFLNDDGNFIGKRGGDLISSSGKIVGQIGASHLVGAFASNAGSAEAYVGGFIATPTATVTQFARGKANGADGLDVGSNNSNVSYKIAGTSNGFAIADTTPSGIRNLHAGLLTGTNLGNPLLDNSMSGIWNANLNARFISSGSGLVYDVASEFKLSVDFDARTIKTLENRGASFSLSSSEFQANVRYTRNDGTTFIAQESSGGVITVDGRFSDIGRVTGTTNFQISNPNNPAFGGGTGILTGLIGEDGLVAAFVSDAGSANAYAGGFTATRAGAGAIFTAGGTDSLTLTGTEAAAATVGTPHPLGITFNEDYVITGTTNGYALASENIANEENIAHEQVKLYAGLLSDIDLGNPLFDNRATGIWSASLNAIILRATRLDDAELTELNKDTIVHVTTTVSSTFDLHVDFDTRTLKTLQDSATSFTFDTGVKRAIRTAGDSPVTALLNQYDGAIYLKKSNGQDIRVHASELITTDCAGIALNIGDPIPLCQTASNGARILVQQDTSVNDCAGNPIAAGKGIPVCDESSPVYSQNDDEENILLTAEGVGIKNCATGVALNVGDRIPLCEGKGSFEYSRDDQGEVIVNAYNIPVIKTESVSSSGRIIIDGRFTSSGVISGKTSFNYADTSESGTLTGAIGANGAVAAFVGDAESGNTYVGGFTATAGDCTIGKSLFNKTVCPDTNIAAKNLRLQLCIDRNPIAMPFTDNCRTSAITILVCNNTGTYANPLNEVVCPNSTDAYKAGFIDECLADPSHADACTTEQILACLNDPFAFACPSTSGATRTAHLNTCGVTTTPPDPRCVNLRVQLNNCSSASPNPTCGTLVNDFCFGGAGRVIAGKTTCVDNIRLACTTNALHPRCRDVGVFTTKETHEAHIVKQRDFCKGAIASLPTGATPLDCNTLGISFDLCGSPTALGSNPFAPICNDAMGNPYFEQVKQAQAFSCRQSAIGDRHADCTEFGTADHWQAHATIGAEVLILDTNGNILDLDKRVIVSPADGEGISAFNLSRLEQQPLKIIPADAVRRDNALVNYIAGGEKAANALDGEKKRLDLAGLIELDENGRRKLDHNGVVINHEPESIANHGGLALSDLDNTKGIDNGFAFASATFAARDTTIDIFDFQTETRNFGKIKLYTGLLAGTDVGAPLVDIQTDAEWTGKIDLINRGTASLGEPNNTITNYATRDFTLLVSFYGPFGIIKNKAPILLKDGAGNRDTAFTIDGRFTDRGVIYGKTSVFARSTNVATGYSSGSLTGLIGADGAVAAFVGGANSKIDNPWGTYAGGFVAIPPASPSTAPRVDFATWRDSLNPTPLAKAFTIAEHTAGNNKGHFVQGTIPGLNLSDDSFAKTRITTLTLGNQFSDGNVFDGVAYTNGTGNRAYAGVLFGTDLGAPLTGTTGTSAQWIAFIQERSYVTSPRPLTLTVRFTATGGTLDGLIEVNNISHIGIDGEFGTNGVIAGDAIIGVYVAGGACSAEDAAMPTVTSACFTDDIYKITSTLTGLIGEQGAVGTFINDTNSFVGGVVATPSAPTYANWRINLARYPTRYAPRENAFLEGTETGLQTTGVRLPANVTPRVLSLSNKNLNGEVTDGVAFVTGNVGSNTNNSQHHFAGILSTTDLGAPLASQPVMTEWPGRIAIGSTYASIKNSAFNLTVTFDTGTNSGTIAAFVPFSAGADQHYKLDATFDANGVIAGGAGTILFDIFTGDNPAMATTHADSHTGTLTGLIGEQGAVGVFISNANTNNHSFSGGFVAVNPN